MKQVYTAVIIGQEGEDLDICFPDFPGCVSGGASIGEALKNGKEALEFHLEGMARAEEEIPSQSDPALLEEMLADSHGEIYRLAVIEAEIPEGRRERINITLPQYVLSRIDNFARKYNRTRSALLAEAALSYLDTAK